MFATLKDWMPRLVSSLATTLMFSASPLPATAEELQLQVYTGKLNPRPNSSILLTEKKALLFDAQFQVTDAKDLVKMLEATGRDLQAILLTHTHPDHVWGAVEVLKRYPGVPVYARAAIKQGIELEFRARLLRWSEIYPDEVPDGLFDIRLLEGDTFDFDGHAIEIVNLKPAETIHATAFYVPETKTFIAGDQIFNDFHAYVGGGLNRGDLWVESIESVKRAYDISTIVPGHGSVGGADLLDKQIAYLVAYEQVSKPKVRQAKIADAMIAKYPHYELKQVLFMTRGPAVTSPELLKRVQGEMGFETDH